MKVTTCAWNNAIVYQQNDLLKQNKVITMKTLKLLLAIGIFGLLGACATQPKDVSRLNAKINEVTTGDFGQFMHHESLAEQNLDEARKIRQWMKDDHYWNINLEGHAVAASDRALMHRKEAEASFTRWAVDWHDRCERHPDYCINEELLSVAYFATGSARAQTVKQDAIDRILRLATIHHMLEIEVIGYTDTVGSASSNMRLAKRRANSINRMLKNQGINSHIAIKRIPIGEAGGPDNTEDQNNRRVDIQVRSYQPFPK